VFYTKYFEKKLTAISYNFFFITKFYKYFLKKRFKTKLAGNMSFFISVWCREKLSSCKLWSS